MKVYLTNLGKYNEGYLIGKWIELPIDEDDLLETLSEIGINEEYEETFITDYEDSPIKIEEYDQIMELNQIAEAYEELDDQEKEVFEYLVNYLKYRWQEAEEVIKEGRYTIYTDIKDEMALGYEIAQSWDIPEYLLSYIDYQAIGIEFIYSGWDIHNGNAYYID